jgi:hypothetical protein
MRGRIAFPKHRVQYVVKGVFLFRPAIAGLSECGRVLASLSRGVYESES